MGPKELKTLRLALTPLSLKNAKKRLIERGERTKDLEENWEAHAKGIQILSLTVTFTLIFTLALSPSHTRFHSVSH